MAKERIYLKIDPNNSKEDFVLIRESGEKFVGKHAGNYIKQHGEEISEAVIIPQGSVPNSLYDASPLSTQITSARKLSKDEFNVKSAKCVTKGTATLFEWIHQKDATLGAESAAKVCKYASRGIDIISVVDKHAKNKAISEIPATDALRIVRDTAGKWFAVSVARSAVLVLIPGPWSFPLSVVVATGVAVYWDDIVNVAAITFDLALDVSHYLDQGDESLDRMFANKFLTLFNNYSNSAELIIANVSDSSKLELVQYNFPVRYTQKKQQREDRFKWGATVLAGGAGVGVGASYTFGGAATSVTVGTTVATTGELSAGITLLTSSALMGPLAIGAAAAIGTYILYSWASDRAKQKSEEYRERLKNITATTASRPDLKSAASALESDLLSESDKRYLQSIWDNWMHAEVGVEDRDFFIHKVAYFFEKKAGLREKRYYQELARKYEQQFYAEQSWRLSNGYTRLKLTDGKDKTEFEKAAILLEDKFNQFVMFLRGCIQSHPLSLNRKHGTALKVQNFMQSVLTYADNSALPSRESYVVEQEWLKIYLKTFASKIGNFFSFIKTSAGNNAIVLNRNDKVLFYVQNYFFNTLVYQAQSITTLPDMKKDGSFTSWAIDCFTVLDSAIDLGIKNIKEAASKAGTDMIVGNNEQHLRNVKSLLSTVGNYSDDRHVTINIKQTSKWGFSFFTQDSWLLQKGARVAAIGYKTATAASVVATVATGVVAIKNQMG